jgi:hypothetical protein
MMRLLAARELLLGLANSIEYTLSWCLYSLWQWVTSSQQLLEKVWSIFWSLIYNLILHQKILFYLTVKSILVLLISKFYFCFLAFFLLLKGLNNFHRRLRCHSLEMITNTIVIYRSSREILRLWSSIILHRLI